MPKSRLTARRVNAIFGRHSFASAASGHVHLTHDGKRLVVTTR